MTDEFPPHLMLQCETEAAKLATNGATLRQVVEAVLRASGHKALVEERDRFRIRLAERNREYDDLTAKTAALVEALKAARPYLISAAHFKEDARANDIFFEIDAALKLAGEK